MATKVASTTLQNIHELRCQSSVPNPSDLCSVMTLLHLSHFSLFFLVCRSGRWAYLVAPHAQCATLVCCATPAMCTPPSSTPCR